MSLVSVILRLFFHEAWAEPGADVPDPSPNSLGPEGRDMWPELVKLDREATDRLLTVQRLRGEVEIQTQRRESQSNA